MNNHTNRKTVLIVHNYYQISGGEDTVVANEKKLLEKHGHKVILYCRNNSELMQMSKLRKLVLPFTTIFNPRTYKEVKELIRTEHIEIVHVHNTLNLVSPAVYYAALKCKIPIVQTIHNFRLLCPGATFYRDGHICEDCMKLGLKSAIIHKCYRNSLLQTLICSISMKIHRILGVYGRIYYICLTEFNKKKLVELEQIKKEKVFVKPNFTFSDFSEKSKIFNSRNNYYVYAGRLDKLKGIDILFETWKILETQMGDDTPVLVVCGGGPLEDWCRQFVLQNNLKKIHLYGFVENSKIKEIISKAMAVILPSRWYEGFPMTIVEAYSVGTPVICTNLGNPASLIKEGITGFKVNDGDAMDIVNCIQNSLAAKVDNQIVYNEYMQNYAENVNYRTLMNIYHTIEKGGSK